MAQESVPESLETKARAHPDGTVSVSDLQVGVRQTVWFGMESKDSKHSNAYNCSRLRLPVS